MQRSNLNFPWGMHHHRTWMTSVRSPSHRNHSGSIIQNQTHTRSQRFEQMRCTSLKRVASLNISTECGRREVSEQSEVTLSKRSKEEKFCRAQNFCTSTVDCRWQCCAARCIGAPSSVKALNKSAKNTASQKEREKNQCERRKRK